MVVPTRVGVQNHRPTRGKVRVCVLIWIHGLELPRVCPTTSVYVLTPEIPRQRTAVHTYVLGISVLHGWREESITYQRLYPPKRLRTPVQMAKRVLLCKKSHTAALYTVNNTSPLRHHNADVLEVDCRCGCPVCSSRRCGKNGC